MAFKAKLLVVGPPEVILLIIVYVVIYILQSGKTYISNLLAEATESSRTIYRPTHGVRILEFGTQGQSDGETVLVDVELWDCAGKQEFENCWPAFAKDTKGVILVYDPNVSSTTRGIEKWYKYFIKKQGLKDSQCILLAVHKVDVQNSPKSWRAPPGKFL